MSFIFSIKIKKLILVAQNFFIFLPKNYHFLLYHFLFFDLSFLKLFYITYIFNCQLLPDKIFHLWYFFYSNKIKNFITSQIFNKHLLAVSSKLLPFMVQPPILIIKKKKPFSILAVILGHHFE